MKKEKICHITNTHPRYDGRILYKECVSLTKDYDVILLVCDSLDDEIVDGVNIISTNMVFKNRIERFIKSKRILKSKINEINADIYHLHEPDLLMLVKFLKKKGKKVIFDSHEDYPVLISEKKWIPKIFRSTISYFYKIYEKTICKKIDGIITVSPHIEKRLKKINNSIEIITNYPFIDIKSPKKKFKREICFAGGIKDYWNHENIILAISEISNIKYKIAGKGDTKYIEKLRNLDIHKKTQMLGHLNEEQIIKLYSESSIGLAICSYISNMGYREGSLGNTKLFEYMANGLPVICTDFEMFKKIIDKYKCGFYVNPYDVDDIREKINLILDNDSLKKQMSENAYRAAKEEFNWGTQEKKLLKFYKGILKK